MEDPTKSVGLCICGCGEPAIYADRHVSRKPRSKLTTADYTTEDRGHTTPCWIFVNRERPRKTGKYNTVRIGGRQILAHRAMYEQEVGPIPKGLLIDHLCRQTHCIRPIHLEPVTNAVNSQRGILAKLTMADARAIRASSESAVKTAERYGVTARLIYRVRRGEGWREESH